MPHKWERLALQITVGVLGFVPVGAGLAGVIYGVTMAGDMADISLDSHFRYLSGLLLAVGLGFWSAIPEIEKNRGRFLLLTLIVFIGGLGRFVGIVAAGVPTAPMLGGLIMELIVTPMLCLWQFRISRLPFNAENKS